MGWFWHKLVGSIIVGLGVTALFTIIGIPIGLAMIYVGWNLRKRYDPDADPEEGDAS